jgi:hypothetical protein
MGAGPLGSAQMVAQLEAENAFLRARARDLMLEIGSLRGRLGGGQGDSGGEGDTTMTGS